MDESRKARILYQGVPIFIDIENYSSNEAEYYEPGVSETGVAERARKSLQSIQELPLEYVDAVSIGIAGFSKKLLARFDSEFDDQLPAISVEFGVNVVAEGGIEIVKASGEATLKVTLHWQRKDQR